MNTPITVLAPKKCPEWNKEAVNEKKQFGVVENGSYPLSLEVWMSLDTFSR